jgi:hypothetical protein
LGFGLQVQFSAQAPKGMIKPKAFEVEVVHVVAKSEFVDPATFKQVSGPTTR